MKKKIIFIGVVVLLSALILGGCRSRGQSTGSQRVELTYWRLFDDEDVMLPLIRKYETSHPNVKVTYRKFVDPQEYQDLILNELAEGEGPDIFQVSNSGLPRFFGKIEPLASEIYTPSVLKENFVSVVARDFVKTDPSDGIDKIYGIPFYVDVPVLYYNEKTFETKIPERGRPAETWIEVMQDADKLRVEDDDGNLLRGAIALGRSDNIDASVDVLFSLMLQEGVDFYNVTLKKATFSGVAGERALSLFASFANSKRKNFSWSKAMTSEDSQLNEIEAFLTGKIAMMVGYADIHTRLELHRKNLKAQGFDVISLSDVDFAPLPQKSKTDEQKRVFAKYYADTVSRTSKNALQAWDLITFLADEDQAEEYADKTKRPSSRRTVLAKQKSDPLLDVFVTQLGFAESIPMANEDKYYEIFSEAIQDVVEDRSSTSSALSGSAQSINRLIPVAGLFPAVQ